MAASGGTNALFSRKSALPHVHVRNLHVTQRTALVPVPPSGGGGGGGGGAPGGPPPVE